METLKYEFGETPVEVIRERLQDVEYPAPILGFIGIIDSGAWPIDDDARETIIIGLGVAAFAAARDQGDVSDAPQTEYGALRIDILAALGIEES